MENKLEQLLNSLIEKGWKPRQHTNFVRCNYCDTYSEFSFETENESGIGEHTLRQLVSKESGLWQFVCENGMIKTNGCCNGWVYHDEYDDYNNGNGIYDEEMLPRYYDTEYQYRLIESSLKDESELEDFLFSNINVEGK